MKRLIPCLLLIWQATLSALPVEKDTLIFLYTADIHGKIYPYDYYRDQPADFGLARISTLVRQYRQNYEHVFLMDGGDMIQGTPLAYYYNRIDTLSPNPFILVMNHLDYDAMAVGNHEIEQGKNIYDKLREESDFPWLSANSLLPDGSPYFQPFSLLQAGDITIGVLGLTTPGIPLWHNKSLYPDIIWTDMVTTASAYWPELTAQSDLQIGIFHAGFDHTSQQEQYSSAGLPPVNASGLVAESLPGFTIIFGGHSHELIPEDSLYISYPEVPVKLAPGAHAQGVGVVKVLLYRQNGSWSVEAISAKVENISQLEPDAAVLNLTGQSHLTTLDYVNQCIGIANTELSTRNAYFRDNPLIEFINRTQMEASGAPISFTACFTEDLVIETGEIQRKDIFALYPYENQLCVLSLTGRQIRQYLEKAASCLQRTEQEISLAPGIAGYNYDMAEGLDYTIDLEQQPGARISNILLSVSSEPLQDEEHYPVALNSYRAEGGGGYLAAIRGLDAPLLYISETEIRDILAEFLSRIGSIGPEVDGNWRILNYDSEE